MIINVAVSSDMKNVIKESCYLVKKFTMVQAQGFAQLLSTINQEKLSNVPSPA